MSKTHSKNMRILVGGANLSGDVRSVGGLGLASATAEISGLESTLVERLTGMGDATFGPIQALFNDTPAAIGPSALGQKAGKPQRSHQREPQGQTASRCSHRTTSSRESRDRVVPAGGTAADHQATNACHAADYSSVPNRREPKVSRFRHKWGSRAATRLGRCRRGSQTVSSIISRSRGRLSATSGAWTTWGGLTESVTIAASTSSPIAP